MIRYLLLNVVLLFLCPCVTAQISVQTSGGGIPTFSFLTAEQNAFVRSEVNRLTLEQKAGQMTQVAIDVIFEGPLYYLTKPPVIDEAKIRRILDTLQIGSILNHPSRTYPYPAEWYTIMQAIQNRAMATTGVPVLYGQDAIHGANYVNGATLFAQPLGMAATFNPELARQCAAMTAYELKAASIPWNFSPAMDVGRNPVWPRNWESFGEDVYLNKVMGEAMVRGYQGDNPAADTSVAACMKHFTGYGSPTSGRDRTPVYLSERQLREYYYPQFQNAIDAGALTIMINSGELNGVPAHVNKNLLTDVLRGEMGFEGLAVSDWSDVRYLTDRHKVAENLKEAVFLSVDAGMDMSMTAVTTEFPGLVVELVREGRLTEARIDLSVARIIATKVALGLYEKNVWNPGDFPKFGGEEHAALSRQSAEEAVVLLKNDGLPLPIGEARRIFVTGPTADNMRSLNGGWTYSWQGVEGDDYLAERYASILEGLEAEFDGRVTYAPGVAYDTLIDIDRAVEQARAADVIVACVGELSYTEFLGNIDELNLPKVQRELVARLAELDKPMVLIMAGGRPRIITDMAAAADAVLYAPYPGPYGGEAIAGILSGRINPSGKLPLTYPRSANSFVLYDHKPTEAIDGNFRPLFQFGHGLSYTDFQYSDLQLSNDEIGTDDNFTATVTVTNAGDRPGRHSVLLFTADEYASVTPNVRRLRAFEKIELAAGESREVTFRLSSDDLSFIDQNNKRIVEPGSFRVMVGTLEVPLTVGAR